jgi:ubiquitin carboxyl-terminal hydrolase L5
VLESQKNELQTAGRWFESAEVAVKLNTENAKRERWAVSELLRNVQLLTANFVIQFENSLRRHNHMGLVHALLVALAKAGKLEHAKVGAKTVMKERIAKRKENSEGDMDDS